jgi:nucleoside-diphosphate-sugar epimerase
MKVLIVGGTGVISSAVVSEAVNQGIDLTCINRGNNYGQKENKGATILHFDVRDLKTAKEALKNMHFDVVVDFVCYNVSHLQKSLDLFHDKCSQYIFISTDSVYKLRKDGHYAEDCEQSNPEWAYSYEKAECEEYLVNYCSSHNLVYTIVRPSITYGNTRIPYGLMPLYGYHYTLVDRMLAGKPIVTWNNGLNYQTMMRVEDFSTVLVGLWCNQQAYNQAVGICGEPSRWVDVLDIIDKHYGISSKRIDVPVDAMVKMYPKKRGEILIDRAEDHIVSNTKMKELVPNYSPKYNLTSGVNETLTYYQNNNKVLGVDYKFDGQIDRLIHSMGGVI